MVGVYIYKESRVRERDIPLMMAATTQSIIAMKEKNCCCGSEAMRIHRRPTVDGTKAIARERTDASAIAAATTRRSPMKEKNVFQRFFSIRMSGSIDSRALSLAMYK